MSKLTAKQFVEQLAYKSKGYIKKYNTLEYAAENNGIEELPIGHIIPYMGLTAPRHYLICDGAEYSTAEYPELFEHLLSFPQTTRAQWGNADWSTKFNVPKLQGEFLRGSGTNGFANQGNGAAVGVHQNATENVEAFLYTNGNLFLKRPNSNSSNVNANRDSSVSGAAGVNYSSQFQPITNSADTASSILRYTSRPTNTSVLFCIRYEPSYNIKVEGKDIYSTEERVIGRWIDGKPIYRKTVSHRFVEKATWEVADASLTNAVLIGSRVNGATIPYFSTATDYRSVIVKLDGGLKVYCNTPHSLPSGDVFITVDYTKT